MFRAHRQIDAPFLAGRLGIANVPGNNDYTEGSLTWVGRGQGEFGIPIQYPAWGSIYKLDKSFWLGWCVQKSNLICVFNQ